MLGLHHALQDLPNANVSIAEESSDISLGSVSCLQSPHQHFYVDVTWQYSTLRLDHDARTFAWREIYCNY